MPWLLPARCSWRRRRRHAPSAPPPPSAAPFETRTQAVLPGATVTATNEDTGLVAVVTDQLVGRSTRCPNCRLVATQVDAQCPVSRRRRGPTSSCASPTISRSISSSRPARERDGQRRSVVRRRSRRVGGDVSGVITGQQVRELPLNGRNFLQLATLMPGVSAPDFLNVKDKGLLGGSDLSVSGSDVTANLWTVDGANNNDVGSNRTILVYPVARRDRGVQDPAQQLRRRSSARRRRRADQHRHARRHEQVQRQRLLLRPQRRVQLRRTTSSRQATSRRTS